MVEFIDNIVALAKATWDLFCMAPLTCLILIATVIISIPVWKATWKRIDEAKGPIILR